DYPPSQANSYSDGSVQAGATYTYWVEYVAGGKVIAKSNSVTVTIPAPEPPPPEPTLQVSLDGYASASGMSLKWGSTGSPLPDTWVVQRNDGSGGYVDYASLDGGSSGGSFTDYKVDPKFVYSWRVAAVSGGSVITYSNPVSNR
ncbi:MAG: hypothetical protein ACYC99_05815, partial [Candidatus Geothermincolia bacterium]